MRLYPTAFLTGLLLACLASNSPHANPKAQQAQASHMEATAQRANVDTRTFHRGSGRLQFFLASTVAA